MLNLQNDQHDLVKKQLQRLEWCGSAGQCCPECGGERPKDKLDTTAALLPDGRFPTISGVMRPDPHEGHSATCALAASIATMSSKDRIVVFCKGDPRGFEEGRV